MKKNRFTYSLQGILAIISALVLLSLVLASVIPCRGESELYSDIIRFHVLANSDNDFDQKLKLSVRDSVCAFTNGLLEGATSINEARAIIENSRDLIIKVADKTIKSKGYEYDTSLFLDYEIYPRRHYGEYTFPAGKYLSLRLKIGKGEGKNWWCVLFPPMCISGAVREGYENDEKLLSMGFSDSEVKLIGEEKSVRKEIRFFALDLINKFKEL